MAIQDSYWRLIKAGERTFESVPESKKGAVRALARADVKGGVITTVQYEEYIGEPYEESDAE